MNMRRLIGVLMLIVVSAGLVAVPVAPVSAALISTQQEIEIGRQAAAEIEGEFGIVTDPALNQYVTNVGLRVAAVSERRELPWTFKILNENEVNAISLPGGFIYVTRGMLSFLRSRDELAFVLAHEIGHVAKRHHVQIIERNFFSSIVLSLIFGRDATAAQIANFARFLMTRGFSREAEFEADRVGVSYAHRARFDAAAGLAFMERLRAAEGRDPSNFEVLFRTHPALADRIVRVRQQLRGLGYQVARRLHKAS